MSKRMAIYLAVLFWSIFVFISVKFARAETLTPAAAPTDWTFISVLVVLGVLIAGGIWYIRNHPGAVTAVKAEGATLAAAIHRLTDWLESQAHTTPAPVLPVEPTLPTPVGKNGVAGVLTIAMTGDPAVDVPAFNKQYFG